MTIVIVSKTGSRGTGRLIRHTLRTEDRTLCGRPGPGPWRKPRTVLDREVHDCGLCAGDAWETRRRNGR